MSLLVTGSIGIDTIETPTGRADEVLGGSSIYFAAAASRIIDPGDVRVLGAVGGDFPDAMLGTFDGFGVDTAGIEKRPGSKSFRWHGKYLDNMNDRETVGVELGVLAEALPPVPDAYRDSETVFLATTTPQNQMALCEQFPERRLVVADTIDLYIQTEREALIELMGQIDGVTFNDAEALLLTEQQNIIAAAETMLGYGLKFVVITRGEHGAFVMLAGDGPIQTRFAALPAYPAKDVVDPTGAGDSFAAGMMAHLSTLPGDDVERITIDQLKTAMAYGTMVASYTIEAFGPGRLESLTRDEIETRLAAYRTMTTLP